MWKVPEGHIGPLEIVEGILENIMGIRNLGCSKEWGTQGVFPMRSDTKLRGQLSI